MVRQYFLMLIYMLIICVLPSFSEQAVAVLDFDSDYFSKSITKTITEKFVQLLLEDGRYIVVERDKIDNVLNELGFQASGCTDNSCAVKIGEILNTERIFIGSINNIDGIIALYVKEIEVSNGQVLKSYESRCNSCDLATLYEKHLPHILSKNKVTGSAVRIATTLSIPVYMDGEYVGNTKSNGSIYGLDIMNVPLGKHIFAVCTLEELNTANQNLRREKMQLEMMGKVKGEGMTLKDHMGHVDAYYAQKKCDKGRTEVNVGENEFVILAYEEYYLYVKVRGDYDKALKGDFTPNVVYPHPTEKKVKNEVVFLI